MKINKQQIILVIFLIGFSIILLNGSSLAFCAFENSKQWLADLDPVVFINKCGDILEALTWKTGKVVLSGSAAYMAIKLAEFGWNLPFLICRRLEESPIGFLDDKFQGLIAWAVGKKKEDGWLKTYVDGTEYTYLGPTIWNFVMPKTWHQPTTYSAYVKSLTAQGIVSPVTDLNVPAVQINTNQQSTVQSSVSAILPVSQLEPDSAPVTPREFPEDRIQQCACIQQPKGELVENGTQASFFPEMFPELVREKPEKLVVYRDRQNLISILNKLDRIDPLLIEHNLILQGLQGIQGRNGLLKEIKNLEQFNDPKVLIKYHYRPLASNLIIKGVKFNFASMLLSNVKLHKHAFTIDLLFGEFNNQTIAETINVDFYKFGKDFPFIAKTLEICFRNAEKHKFQLGIPKPYINLVYRQESTGYFGSVRNIIIPEESTIVYTSTGNTFPLMDTVLDLFSAQNDMGVQPEIDGVCRSLKKYIGKNLLGVPKETDIITIVYDNVASSLNTHETASLFIATEKRTISINPLTRKPRIKETGIQNTIEVDRPYLPMNSSCDVVSPAVVGGTVLVTGAISGLAQIPIEDAWNVIFNSQACAPLLSDPHFISSITNVFPNLQIPVQETARALDTAHSVVDTVVTNFASSSTSPVAEGSLSVSKINVTSSLSGIVPSFSWGNIAIGIGIVGVVACTYYGIKYGVSVNGSDVKEVAKAVINDPTTGTQVSDYAKSLEKFLDIK